MSGSASRILLQGAVALMLLNGAWMAFDGGRALVVGDYVTPRSGAYAGQLGPWAKLLSAIGLEPRSTAVKLGFVVLGAASVLACAGHFLGVPGARRALPVLAALVLWYLPFGTAIGALVLLALLVG
jgi:hypothetical protein